MSNFAFLQPEWLGLHDAAAKAEALAYPDARTAQRESLAELNALFATLQHRAFKGEL